jgi:hypothetical protein
MHARTMHMNFADLKREKTMPNGAESATVTQKMPCERHLAELAMRSLPISSSLAGRLIFGPSNKTAASVSITSARFPKMIALRLGERMRQRLASFNTRSNGLLDGGQSASSPVFRLDEVENFTILRKAGDEPRHDAT